jgi:hypothetical protein
MTTLPFRRTHTTVVERMRRPLAELNSKGETPRETVAGDNFLFDMLRLQYSALKPEH